MKTESTENWYLSVWDTLVINDKPPREEFESKLKELIDAQPLKELRTKRNTLLDQTDKYIVADWPHPTSEARQAWIDYRQALRDLPANTEDPENPIGLDDQMRLSTLSSSRKLLLKQLRPRTRKLLLKQLRPRTRKLLLKQLRPRTRKLLLKQLRPRTRKLY